MDIAFLCYYYKLESRDSEENISTKSWKKTARFIKVFPVEIVPCFEEMTFSSRHLLLHNNRVSLRET